MDKLIPFDYFGKGLRATMQNDEPWFVAKDVCDILGLDQVSRAMDRLDPDERGLLKVPHPQNPEKEIQVNGVTESGLYQLILASNKPESKPFKRWVTHEVIPSIRRHGAYMTPGTIEKVLSDPDTIIRLATELKEERAQKAALAQQIETERPKVNFANSVSGSVNSILVRDLAKLIAQNGRDIGEKRLFRWLRENGYLIARVGRDYNSPTQRSMDLGLMEVKETAIDHASGYSETKRTPLITGKGQQYFLDRLKEAA